MTFCEKEGGGGGAGGSRVVSADWFVRVGECLGSGTAAALGANKTVSNASIIAVNVMHQMSAFHP